MPEGSPGAGGLGYQAGPGQQLRPRGQAGQLRRDVDVELGTGYGGRFEQGPFRRWQSSGAQQHRFPHPVRNGGVRRARQPDCLVAVGQPSAVAERERQLLDGERDTVRPARHGGRQAGLGCCPEQVSQHRPDCRAVQRCQADLG